MLAASSHNEGPFAQSIGLSIEFGEDDNGNKDQEEVNAIYDAQYYFNDQFYAFALGRISVNGLVDGERNSGGQSNEDFAAEFSNLRRDAFLGFGPGYRVINTPDTAWRVQAGIGVRYAQTGAQYAGFDIARDADGNAIFGAGGSFDTTPVGSSSETETGYIASSRFYHRFNEVVFVTNDTDWLGSSDIDDVITNEFGVNFQVSEQLATRMSYTTEYQENREIRTDNRLGVAVVYGF